MTNRRLTRLLVLSVIALSVTACTTPTTQTATQTAIPTQPTTVANSTATSHIETLTYDQEYDGTTYSKALQVYVPDSYEQGTPMNILYLMHGSTGDSEGTVQAMKPVLDRLIQDGTIQPTLVVFPTYYPDRSFVVSNYSQDYPLNHFFATTEIETVLPLVEGTYTTYATDTTPQGLRESRTHRAFGGYSMGGITTWDMLVEQSPYFASYMPMAGDSWIGRITGESGVTAVAQTLTSGLQQEGYTADDVRIIAMVGEQDGTKASMQPQIQALRQTSYFNDTNLIYWENPRGGHSLESFIAEVEHGLPLLF